MKIAFFDSGIGGLTIFKEAFKDIKADYIYFADNLNTPYGIKSKEYVKQIVVGNIRKIVECGADIIVIACNTATSVAINDLRGEFIDKCIIGTEPAVKVAVDEKLNNKKILISATTLTTKEEKLEKLIDKLNVKNRICFIPLDKLVEFAEKLEFKSNNVIKYLQNKFVDVDFSEYSHLVLGCTHFPFFKEAFRKIVPENIEIIDSSHGVIKNVKNSIRKLGLIEDNKSNVTLILTKEDNNFIQKFSIITGIDKYNVKVV